jgi:hypothetical protein
MSLWIFGDTPFAVRLPSILAFIGTTLILFGLPGAGLEEASPCSQRVCSGQLAFSLLPPKRAPMLWNCCLAAWLLLPGHGQFLGSGGR